MVLSRHNYEKKNFQGLVLLGCLNPWLVEVLVILFINIKLDLDSRYLLCMLQPTYVALCLRGFSLCRDVFPPCGLP